MSNEITIFERILKGEIPAKKIYEDEYTFAVHDISPQAPVHVLVIPKTKIANVGDAQDQHAELLGRILLAAAHVAKLLDIEKSGYRLVFNNGNNGGQTVPYLHCHVMGGRAMQWPPG